MDTQTQFFANCLFPVFIYLNPLQKDGNRGWMYVISLLDSPLVCRNIRLGYPRMQVSYIAGGKYCRRCEYYFFTQRLFCECCGMRLRGSQREEYTKKRLELRKNRTFHSLFKLCIFQCQETRSHYELDTLLP
jgi:hypothetical protein